MNGLSSWMEKYILPVAAKIGAQKHLVALRDAFIGTLPATMAGSVAVMINAIIRDLPQQFNRIRQKSPILYRWVMNAVRYEGYRW